MSLSPNHYLTVEVRRIREETPLVRSFELTDPDDWDLPPFSAGAHVNVHLADGLMRPYSICSDPADRGRYVLGIRLKPDSEGGSLAMHRRVQEGQRLSLSLPRNHFPLRDDGRRYVLIAGGIGITPLLAMTSVLARRRRDFHLYVCTPSLEHTPFREVLAPLIAAGRASLHHDGPQAGRNPLDADALLASQEPGLQVYCCGPEGLMRRVQLLTQTWPEQSVHFERFNRDAAEVARRECAYDVQLARTGRVLRVEAHETLAQALRRAGIAMDTSCEAGTCGTCKVAYIAGQPTHRDFVLRASERQRFLTPCVSGGEAGNLVLDL